MPSKRKNMEAWAMTQGYDPDFDYTAAPAPLPDGYISENFRLSEFTCNHCGEMHPNGLDENLLPLLEQIRSHFGDMPISVNSGYRCPVHNTNCGGAKNSYHLEAMATDFTVKGVSPYDVYEYCDTLIGDLGGVGKYDSFTHIDVRGYKSRWVG